MSNILAKLFLKMTIWLGRFRGKRSRIKKAFEFGEVYHFQSGHEDGCNIYYDKWLGVLIDLWNQRNKVIGQTSSW